MASVTLTPLAWSDKAILLRDDDLGEEEWFPLSLLDDDLDPDYLEKGVATDFEIPSWLLEQKGFL